MRSWLRNVNTVVLSLAAVGLFVLLTFFLHSMKGVQWDLTANRKFTLSDKTITTLKNLDRKVHAIAFTESGQGVVSRQIKDLLDEYQKRSSYFTWEEVDPKKQPSLAQKYEISSYGTIVFESGEQTKSITSSELFGYGSEQTSYTFNGEAKFTQAILGLVSDEKRIAYAITGHQELTLTNAYEFRRGLENEGLEVRELNLFQKGEVPEDADLLLVLAPQKDISEKEADLLLDYMKDKGKLYMALSLSTEIESWTQWNRILNAVGVQNQNALVMESSQTLSADPLTIVPQLGYHDVVNKLREQRSILVMPGSLALSQTESEESKDYTITSLLKTGQDGFGKTNLAPFITTGGRVTQDDLKKAQGDLEGPIDFAYAIQDQESKPKAIVIGNGLFLRDDWFAEQSNKDFALNSVGWLNEQEELVTIRPREEAVPDQAYVTAGGARMIFWGSVVGFPALFLVAGGIVWWRRRRG